MADLPFDLTINLGDNLTYAYKKPIAITKTKIMEAMKVHQTRQSKPALPSEYGVGDFDPSLGRKILTSSCNAVDSAIWRDDILIAKFDFDPAHCRPDVGCVAQVGPILDFGPNVQQHVSCKCPMQFLYSLNRYKAGSAVPLD